MKVKKIVVEDVKIERINNKHNITNFRSYEQELVKFLKEDALSNQEKQISVTYLWFLTTGELIGYITLLNDLDLVDNLKFSL